MIFIEEKFTEKLPGTTSLFVSFDFDPQVVQVVKSLDCSIYNKKNKTWEVPLSQLTEMVDTLTYIDDISIKLFPDLCEKVHYYKPTLEYKTPPFKHQIEAIEYGLNRDKWLLLDVPGLGKTISSIYLAEELKAQRGLEHCLVVCGFNSLKTNWENEIKKHSKLDCAVLGKKVSSKGKVSYTSISKRAEQLRNPIDEFFIITNIETLRSDEVIDAILNGQNKIDMIVVDEAHKVKSQSSQQGSNLLKLNKSKYRIAATGTLLMNNPLDAYVPLKWIGEERSNLTNFKNFYCIYSGRFNNILTGFKNIGILKDQLSNCSLRRTKDLLDLPSKLVIDEYVDMEEDQTKFYNVITSGVKADIKEVMNKVTVNKVNLLSLITRLRQATACPSILTTDKISACKIERAKDLIEQITSNGEKVVVFSNFKETIYQLASQLEEYKPLVCTGDTDQVEIDKNKELFQTDPSRPVMLNTIAKMGTGHTLTAASYMIFIDCTWTAAQNGQCEDRIHRIGTSKPVTIYYLWARGTIDEKVKAIVEDKSLIADFVIDDKVSPGLESRLMEIIEDL